MKVLGREIHDDLVGCGQFVGSNGLLLFVCFGRGTDWLYPRASGPLLVYFFRAIVKVRAYFNEKTVG